MKSIAVALLLAGGGSPLAAQVEFVSGVYITPDERYSITVERTPAGLKVTEPNRTTVYAPTADPRDFTAVINNRSYRLRIAEPQVLYSFSQGSSTGTRLRLLRALAQPPTAATERFEAPPVPPHAALDAFQEYRRKIETDPANTHVHAACGAAAIAKATFNKAGYEAYVAEIVRTLKPILVNPDVNPCPTRAIEAALWRTR